MQQSIISVILFVGLLFALPVGAGNIELRSDTPDRHIVVPGDTLWDISARFLKDPWRWPQIWGLNRTEIKNPHKIYPGDIIVLERTLNSVRLRLAEDKATVKLSPGMRLTEGQVDAKLSPRMRIEETGISAIPSISAAAIEPFLSQPLVVDKNELANAPYILGSSDNRVVLDTSEIIYTSALPEDQGSAWQIFRPGKALRDPDASDRILGYEATYLGDIRVKVFDEISTATITRSVQEIQKGDRLVAAADVVFNNYMPHAPDLQIEGRIISVYGGVSEFGKGAIITLNKGVRDGIEMGHVLAVYRRSQAKTPDGKIVSLPDERTGLVFVFRVFEKVSYALVMQGTQSIKILDAVKTP